MKDTPTITDNRITATASCAFCQWTARLTGDSPVEVATFLRARILDHVRDQHPDHAADVDGVDRERISIVVK